MKGKYLGIIWGTLIVLVGAWFLVTKRIAGMIIDPYLGIMLYGGLSLLFLASYYISGTKHWGWLFPACIFAGMMMMTMLSLIPGLPGRVAVSPVLLTVAVPFLVVYLQETQTHRWALIPIYAMTTLTIIVPFSTILRGELVSTMILVVVGLPFLMAYLIRRRTQVNPKILQCTKDEKSHPISMNRDEQGPLNS